MSNPNVLLTIMLVALYGTLSTNRVGVQSLDGSYLLRLASVWIEVIMAKDRVEAVERALTLLDTFADGSTKLKLHDLARRTGFYKSTILRLAASLEHKGYLVRDKGGAFELGPGIGKLVKVYRSQFNPEYHIRGALARLAERVGETASFYIRDGAERICLYRHNAAQEIRHHLEEGARLPLERGAAGRVLLAFGGDVGMGLDSIRKNGYCVSRGERNPQVFAVAVPVYFDAILAGALAVSGPRERFSDAVVETAVVALQEESALLGSVDQ